MRSQYSRSTNSASPSLSHLGMATYGRAPSTAGTMPPGSGNMSIGSIIEHDRLHGDYRARSMPHGLSELSAHTAIGTAPRSLHPDMLYGFGSAGDSPLYSSSDSCYSPLSDYIQPSQPMAPYYGADIVRPQTVAAESAYQAMVHSPAAAHSPISLGPATPAWGPSYDPVALSYTSDVSYVHAVSFDPEQHEDIRLTEKRSPRSRTRHLSHTPRHWLKPTWL